VTLKIKFSAEKLQKTGTLVLIVAEDGKWGKFAKSVDKQTGGQLTRVAKAADFSGKRDQNLEIVAPDNTDLSRIVLFGCGQVEKLDSYQLELLGGEIAGKLKSLKIKSAGLSTDMVGKSALGDAEIAARVASGARLRIYDFELYKTKKKTEAKDKLSNLTVLTAAAAGARKNYVSLDAIATGVHMARDLVNEPGNVLTPPEFAARAKELSKLGIKVQILSEKQMEKLGMGSLLSVGEGSVHQSHLAIMRWEGGPKSQKPVAFVGKGVTFDTGGISLKPGANMWDMKGDMGGAACVTGLMAALAGRKAKVNAVGVIALVENMPDAKATRPGDVVTSMSGQTIAVLNTDAEGRLVLADALWYTQSKFKPQIMINLATLTGAILVALGSEYAGLFSNNDELSERLHALGQKTGEKVWRLPLAKEYDKLIDSDIADMKNIGGRFAGSITAGQFLQRFVNDTAWAHLDIAGTAMDSPKTAINQSWSSGWGVRLLNELVAEHYEK
jgi:leucyl aminopeptidase